MFLGVVLMAMIAITINKRDRTNVSIAPLTRIERVTVSLEARCSVLLSYRGFVFLGLEFLVDSLLDDFFNVNLCPSDNQVG